MMTEPLFRTDPYLRRAPGRIVGLTPEGGIVLDQSLFYATAGGQPGDSGKIVWDGGEIAIATAVKGEAGAIVLVPAAPVALPPVGAAVEQALDWERRYRHMRVHTALHLLSVAIPLPVTGGQIGTEKGRLDFDMPEVPADVQAIEDTVNRMIAQGLQVSDDWITDAELAALNAVAGHPRAARLVRLDLSGCEKITDAGLAAVSALGGVTHLNLYGCRELTAAGTALLARMTALVRLDLTRCTRLTDTALTPLATLPALEHLSLAGCEWVTDAGLAALAAVRTLKVLSVRGTQISPAAADRFRLDRPGCAVEV